MKIKPMQINVPGEDIGDLRKRFENTRWSPPEEITNDIWQFFTEVIKLKKLERI